MCLVFVWSVFLELLELTSVFRLVSISAGEGRLSGLVLVIPLMTFLTFMVKSSSSKLSKTMMFWRWSWSWALVGVISWDLICLSREASRIPIGIRFSLGSKIPSALGIRLRPGCACSMARKVKPEAKMSALPSCCPLVSGENLEKNSGALKARLPIWLLMAHISPSGSRTLDNPESPTFTTARWLPSNFTRMLPGLMSLWTMFLLCRNEMPFVIWIISFTLVWISLSSRCPHGIEKNNSGSQNRSTPWKPT